MRPWQVASEEPPVLMTGVLVPQPVESLTDTAGGKGCLCH